MFIVRRILKILLRIVISFIVLSVGLTLIYKWYKVPVTPLMLIRCSEQWSAGEKLSMKHDWVALEDFGIGDVDAVVVDDEVVAGTERAEGDELTHALQ